MSKDAGKGTRRSLAVGMAAVAGLVGLGGAASGCEEAETRPTLRLADVSFLLPLDGGSSLGANSAGAHGVLVPRARFDGLEPLTRVDEPDALYAGLKVVGVRLDPCFVEGLDDSPCASQVRLVLQPVVAQATGGWTTRDAAVHAFYAVPRQELDELAWALAALREGLGDALGDTLGVHAAAEEAADLVLEHIGEARLTRLTTMSVHPSGEAWVFAGFDLPVGGGAAVPIDIPGVEEHDQHLTSTGATRDLAATLLPEPVIEPSIAVYLDAERRAAASEAETAAGVAAIERLLDPQRHDPGTADCASCHVATTGLRFATRGAAPGRVPAVYDDTRNQRMFGWFDAQPSISPRVVSESQAVLDRLTAFD